MCQQHFKVLAELFLRGHLLNPLWHSRERRRAVRGAVKIKLLDDYFRRRYLPSVLAMEESVPLCEPDEKIYSIWLQGEQNAPDLVKACFSSIRRHCSRELVVLDEFSLDEMISLPEVIVRKYKSGRMRPAHYTDICRLELLHRYGGCWMDATCFATAAIPQEIWEQDFFVYLAGERLPSSYSFIQNCFIRARRGSFLLESWRRMVMDYWMSESGTLDYLQHQLMFRTIVRNEPRAARLFDSMLHIDQDPTHTVWWTLRDKPYDADIFAAVTGNAFFQKTSYLDAINPIPGTTMYEMIYGSQPESGSVIY